MHEATGEQKFVRDSLAEIIRHLKEDSDEVRHAVGSTIGNSDPAIIQQERIRLVDHFLEVQAAAEADVALPYVHYASRVSVVGLYQSVLAKVFSRIPGLQGYGNANPVWIITPIEQAGYTLKAFFSQVFELHGQHKPLLQSVLEAWKDIRVERAPYPSGTSAPIAIPDTCVVALLADWVGDNPAAKRVATAVCNAKPDYAIHPGDIYYGGVKEECEAFLRNWPL